MQNGSVSPSGLAELGAQGEDAIALVHLVLKEIEWIRKVSSRLCRSDRDPERLGVDLECILELSGSVAHSMRRFLDDARGSDPGSIDMVEIGPLLDESVRRVRRRGVGPEILVQVDGSVRRSLVPESLLVAIVAVLENATEFSAEGQQVWLRASADGRALRIAIEDRGKGMDSGVLTACLERGFTTRLGNGGHGLGLYAAAKVVARSRGEMLVESELGAGTSVVLSIPASAWCSGAESPA